MPSNPRMSRTASRSRDGVTARARRPHRVRVEVAASDPVPDRWQRWIALGNLLSVLFLAVGLYLTYQANQETSTANREQRRLTEQGQITDRFSTAVEQLGQSGTDKIDVRLGAIYSLERIMRDSAVDHPAVVDVLTAFVRVHAPAPGTDPSPKPTSSTEKPSSPPADIQAALTVLGRRDATRDRGRLDLSRTDLAGANLTGANLTGAYLFRANLSRVTLFRTGLAGADLLGADLTKANLRNADLAGANLLFTNVTDADFSCARTDNETILPTGLSRPAVC